MFTTLLPGFWSCCLGPAPVRAPYFVAMFWYRVHTRGAQHTRCAESHTPTVFGLWEYVFYTIAMIPAGVQVCSR